MHHRKPLPSTSAVDLGRALYPTLVAIVDDAAKMPWVAMNYHIESVGRNGVTRVTWFAVVGAEMTAFLEEKLAEWCELQRRDDEAVGDGP